MAANCREELTSSSQGLAWSGSGSNNFALGPRLLAEAQLTQSTVFTSATPESREPGRNKTIFATVTDDVYFQNVTLAIIVANAIWLGLELEWNHSRLANDDGKKPFAPVDTIVENFFCLFFFFEVVVRFLAFEYRRYCWKDGWFVFDTVLVLFMVLEAWVTPLIILAGVETERGDDLTSFGSFRLVRVVRLLRLTRMARIMRAFPELMTLIKGMIRACQAVGFILLFLMLVMFVFGILFTSQFGKPNGGEPLPGEEDEDATAAMLFASLGSSMMTLLTNGVLGDNLAQTLQAIMDGDDGAGFAFPYFMWLFILFSGVSSITLLNMLIGVLCQVICDTERDDKEALQIKELNDALSIAFTTIDSSGDGFVNEKEFRSMKHFPEARTALKCLGIEGGEELDRRLDALQHIIFSVDHFNPLDATSLDQDTLTSVTTSAIGSSYLGEDIPGARTIDFDEFVSRLLDLRPDTPAAATDVDLLKAKVRLISTSVQKTLSKVEAGLAKLVLTKGVHDAFAGRRAPPVFRCPHCSHCAHWSQCLAEEADGEGPATPSTRSSSKLGAVASAQPNTRPPAAATAPAEPVSVGPSTGSPMDNVPTEVLWQVLKAREPGRWGAVEARDSLRCSAAGECAANEAALSPATTASAQHS